MAKLVIVYYVPELQTGHCKLYVPEPMLVCSVKKEDQRGLGLELFFLGGGRTDRVCLQSHSGVQLS